VPVVLVEPENEPGVVVIPVIVVVQQLLVGNAECCGLRERVEGLCPEVAEGEPVGMVEVF
jgi:hypothetical protein